jgi:quercetin dioxygenase-like cupin family protein
MKTTSDIEFDSALTESLLSAVAPVELAPARKAALRDRILKRVRSEKSVPLQSHLTVHFSNDGWIDVMPLIEMKTLFESDSGKGVLFRFQPGARLPAHEHGTDEECVVLEGELCIGDDMVVRGGDFHLARRGIPHGDLTSPTGALFYIRTGANFKFTPIRA